MSAATEAIAIFESAIAAGSGDVGKGNVRGFEAGRVEIADIVADGLEAIRISGQAAKPDVDGAEHINCPP
jgi:hypothetical protein